MELMEEVPCSPLRAKKACPDSLSFCGASISPPLSPAVSPSISPTISPAGAEKLTPVTVTPARSSSARSSPNMSSPASSVSPLPVGSLPTEASLASPRDACDVSLDWLAPAASSLQHQRHRGASAEDDALRSLSRTGVEAHVLCEPLTERLSDAEASEPGRWALPWRQQGAEHVATLESEKSVESASRNAEYLALESDAEGPTHRRELGFCSAHVGLGLVRRAVQRCMAKSRDDVG